MRLVGNGENEEVDGVQTGDVSEVVRDEIIVASFIWRDNLGRAREPFTPPMLAKVALAGLRAAGVKADLARSWAPGRKYPTTLPMVIEFACPFWHRTPNNADFEKVRLVVMDNGWFSVFEESCPSCQESMIRDWLLSCRICRTGERPPWRGPHRPDHPALAIDDASPLRYLRDAYKHAADMVDACWWRDLPDEWRNHWRKVLRDGDDAMTVEEIEGLVQAFEGLARHRLKAAPSVDPPAITPSRKAEWTTAEQAAAWLDVLTEPAVPPGAGQQSAWEAVRRLQHHPPQALVHGGQALRKERWLASSNSVGT